MQTEATGIPEAEPDITVTTKVLEHGDFSADHFIDQVAVEALDVPLEYCLPLLERALNKTTDYDIAGLEASLRNGEAMLLIEWQKGRPQACAAVCVMSFLKGRAAHIMAIAAFPGRSTKYPNPDSFALLMQHVRLWGCTCIQGFAVASTARLWQRAKLQEVYRLMRIEL